MAPVFEIFLDRKKQYRFRLRAANGEIVCQSEAYTTKAKAKKGITAIFACLASIEQLAGGNLYDSVVDLTRAKPKAKRRVA